MKYFSKKLGRYIGLRYLTWVFGLLLLCVLLFSLFDFIHQSTRYFAEHQAQGSHILLYYLYNLPQIVLQTLGAVAMIACVVTIISLARTNEITAMRAAGVGPLGLFYPIILSTLFIVGLSFVIGEFIAPKSAQRTRYISRVLIEKKEPDRNLKASNWIRQDRTFFYFQEFDLISGTLSGMQAISMSDHFLPNKKIVAKTALKKSDNLWELFEVVTTYFNENGLIIRQDNEKKTEMVIPVDLSTTQRLDLKIQEMTLPDLVRSIQLGKKSSRQTDDMQIELYFRLAMHLAPLILCLLGLKYLFRSERQLETARSLFLTLALGISYWFLISFFRTVAHNDILPKWLAASIPNLIMVIVAFYDFKLAKALR